VRALGAERRVVDVPGTEPRVVGPLSEHPSAVLAAIGVAAYVGYLVERRRRRSSVAVGTAVTRRSIREIIIGCSDGESAWPWRR